MTGSLNASLAQWLIGSGHAPSSYVAAQGTELGRWTHPRSDLLIHPKGGGTEGASINLCQAIGDVDGDGTPDEYGTRRGIIRGDFGTFPRL